MKMQFEFVPAQRKKSKARIAISGASGAGKTYTALELATGFAGDTGLIAVIDSQHGQSNLYANKYDFRVLEIDTHSPLTYAAAIRAADEQGFDVIVVDSISLAWSGKDGALAQVDKFSKKYNGNSYFAWGDVTPMQQEMIQAMLSAKAHVIVTLRSKMKHEIMEDDKGKNVPVRIGMGNIQRDDFEYELDVELYMNQAHYCEVVKTRYEDLDGYGLEKPDRELAKYILEQLEMGEEPADEHWSDSFRNRQGLLSVLEKKGIPTEALFACYGANNWGDMRQVELPEGGSMKIVERVNEWWADNPDF